MHYLQIDGPSDEWFVLFHGTGGSEYSLLQIAGDLYSKASILTFSGDVAAGASRRFFAPLEQGQLNRTDFNTRIDDFLSNWPSIRPNASRLTFIGYSNGANFVLGLLEKQPHIAERVVLLHPSNLQYDFQAGSDAQIIMTTGAMDTLSLPGDVLQLSKQLEAVFPNTTLKLLDGGHGTTDAEIDYVKHMLKS
ncbi:alpha/beta hydrolase [Kurthia massiliensis]|uniref:alpha/beta hydrolase n=1 Tax=Kurthia massiliensis TaxID=1033739 RepID=UPI0002897BF4|nr:hypothetical protein [Kurthia massiliensis]